MDMNEFEIIFSSDEEVWEMLDNIILAMGGTIEADESKPAILNPIRFQQMQFSYGAINYLTRNTDAKLTYALNEPYMSMGSISVESRSLEFTNALWFCRAAEFASNTEIYPSANGKVRLTMTFHGLARSIE